jgi:hypothetical protein
MQRLMMALAAFLSLLTANLLPAGAQRTPGEVSDILRSPTAEVVELPADRTVSTLVVRDKTFVLSGHVTQDVMAINCHTLIKPGASVGNVLTAIGGTVEDESDGQVRVIKQSAELAESLAPTTIVERQTVPVPTPRPTYVVVQNRVVHPSETNQSWAGGQFALLLMGLLASLIALVVAPRAAEHTGEGLAQEPGRCLVVGVMGAAAMTLVLAFSYSLMLSPLGVIWKPLGAAFAGLCLSALGFGWVCGMRYVGQGMARRLGRGGSVGIYLQCAIGLGAFFLVNVVSGGVHRSLGVMGLLVETLLALTGLGAALLSGFGADPNWLTARLRGEVRWLARSPRL